MACHKRGPRFWERPSVSISRVRPRHVPELVSYVRIEERELEAGGPN